MPPWLPSSLDHGRIGAEQKGPPPQLQPDHMLTAFHHDLHQHELKTTCWQISLHIVNDRFKAQIL